MVLWHEDAYTRTTQHGEPETFEHYRQRQASSRQAHKWWSFMSKSDAQLYAVTGAGFFLDSYDLFIVNLVSPIWEYEYFGGLAPPHKTHYPPLLRGLVNSSANIGNIIGQLAWGYLGDIYGRRFVYGNELILGTLGLILCISLPNSITPAKAKMAWILCWRIVLGIGIGGDYPISASIVAERTQLHSRGQMLGWIFSNQGWGNLVGCIITLIILGCFSTALQNGEYGQLDAVWRLQIGLALLPALAMVRPRLTMPEGKKYLESREISRSRPASGNSTSSWTSTNGTHTKRSTEFIVSEGHEMQEVVDAARAEIESQAHRPKLDVFLQYIREWRHMKVLLGTASCWFLLDVAFYGINLNQSVILEEIGFSKGDTEYEKLKRNAIGNFIIAIAGYVPGYFFTIAFVERLGRRWIQIQGFLICSLMFAILAGGQSTIGTGGKFVCLALAQFFFNFGPNATTFIIPAEVFPTRVRGLGHGVSAAAGKLGAILSALLFNYLSRPEHIGIASVLWIYFACNLLGAVLTWFLIPETRMADADVNDYNDWFETHVLQRR